MISKIPVPGDSQFGAAVARRLNDMASMEIHGMLQRDGVIGTGSQPFPKNMRERKSSPEVHPWKVYALAKSEDVDHCFEIYIPSGSLHVGEDSIEVEGVTPVEGSSDRYTIDCEEEIMSQSTLTLAVYRDDDAAETEGVSSSEDETPYWSAKIISDLEVIEDAEEVLAILPIATVSIDSSGDEDVGNVDSQLVRSAVALTFVNSTTPDKVSIDEVTEESAEDPSALQVKDFDNDDSDGSQGLAQRLKVVKTGDESFEIKSESNASSIHLVARVNGKIKYIPLSGSKEKDSDEEDPDKDDPCAHDISGSSGGVSPDDEDEERSYGIFSGGGGVPVDGDQYHTGDDNCNCP